MAKVQRYPKTIESAVVTEKNGTLKERLKAIDTDLALKAPVANPTLTGTPKAPTPGASSNDTQIATTAFVNSQIISKLAAADAMIYKGTLGTGGTVTALPASHTTGWTYKVITAGTYAGQKCEIGDMIICLTTGTTATDAHWTVVQTNIDGAVIGPDSAVADRIAVFNGATGKLLKDGGKTLTEILSEAKNLVNATGILGLDKGGTGANTVAGAKTNLGISALETEISNVKSGTTVVGAASKLSVTRSINGLPFNGTSDISDLIVPDALSSPVVSDYVVPKSGAILTIMFDGEFNGSSLYLKSSTVTTQYQVYYENTPLNCSDNPIPANSPFKITFRNGNYYVIGILPGRGGIKQVTDTCICLDARSTPVGYKNVWRHDLSYNPNNTWLTSASLPFTEDNFSRNKGMLAFNLYGKESVVRFDFQGAGRYKGVIGNYLTGGNIYILAFIENNKLFLLMYQDRGSTDDLPTIPVNAALRITDSNIALGEYVGQGFRYYDKSEEIWYELGRDLDWLYEEFVTV